MEDDDQLESNATDDKLHNYMSKKVKSNDDEGLTLLELQRSSAVISGNKNHQNSPDNPCGDSTSLSDKLAWSFHFDSHIVDLVTWRDTSKSLFTFLWIVTTLFLLRSHSFLYILTASLISLLTVMMVFVGGCSLFQAATKDHVIHPFASTLSNTIALSQSTQATISQILLGIITGSVDFVARIVLVQSCGLTMRSIALLWIIWSHMEDIYIFLIIFICIIFTVPKLYLDHAESFESLIEIYEENPLTGIINAHFKIKECSRINSATKKICSISQSKDMLSASLSGVIIVLAVKYFLSD